MMRKEDVHSALLRAMLPFPVGNSDGWLARTLRRVREWVREKFRGPPTIYSNGVDCDARGLTALIAGSNDVRFATLSAAQGVRLVDNNLYFTQKLYVGETVHMYRNSDMIMHNLSLKTLGESLSPMLECHAGPENDE